MQPWTGKVVVCVCVCSSEVRIFDECQSYAFYKLIYDVNVQ